MPPTRLSAPVPEMSVSTPLPATSVSAVVVPLAVSKSLAAFPVPLRLPEPVNTRVFTLVGNVYDTDDRIVSIAVTDALCTVSAVLFTTKTSLPVPPISVATPAPAVKVSLPEFACSTSAIEFPVPVSAADPVSTSTETLADSVSLNAACRVSVPCVAPTVTTSAELFRTNISLPVPPTKLSMPVLDTNVSAPLPATNVSAPDAAAAVSRSAPAELPVPLSAPAPVNTSVLTLTGSVKDTDELMVSTAVVDAL